jgi:hypothetical protein
MHCYRCGIYMKKEDRHVRRNVPTHLKLLRRYPGSKVERATTSYGRRVVCRRCSRIIDLTERRLELAENAKLAAALAVLFSIIAWKMAGG